MQAIRPTVNILTQSTTTATTSVTIPCLYTKQKTKKRKTFNDGYLKVSESNGHCALYSASDNFISAKEGHLDSQFISPAEAKKVLQGNLNGFTGIFILVTINPS